MAPGLLFDGMDESFKRSMEQIYNSVGGMSKAVEEALKQEIAHKQTMEILIVLTVLVAVACAFYLILRFLKLQELKHRETSVPGQPTLTSSVDVTTDRETPVDDSRYMPRSV